jgi:hypothetical protein
MLVSRARALTAALSFTMTVACNLIVSSDYTFAPPDASRDAGNDVLGAPESCPTFWTHPLLSQQCSESGASTDCSVCEEANCCDTRAACEAVPECSSYLDCLLGCREDFDICSGTACHEDIDTCVGLCKVRYPGAEEPVSRRLACLSIRCSEQCLSATDACAACASLACGDVQTDCEIDPSCAALLDCHAACQLREDQEICLEGCKLRHPSGVELFDVFRACQRDTLPRCCAGSC